MAQMDALALEAAEMCIRDRVCPEDVKSIYAGHEVASHGLYHATICDSDPARCLNEILACRKELERCV